MNSLSGSKVNPAKRINKKYFSTNYQQKSAALPQCDALAVYAFIFNALRAASAICAASSPYASSSSAGVPDCPNLSPPLINSSGAGQDEASTAATASPRPPAILCSSATTAAPVFLTDALTASQSRGLTVATFRTSALIPSVSSISAA